MATAAIMSSATHPDDLSLLLLLVRDVTVLSILRLCRGKRISMSLRTCDDFKQKVFRGKCSHRKPKRREVETPVTIGPCVPIVFCVPLASTHLVAERKVRTQQVTRENIVTKFVMLRKLRQVLNLIC